MRETQIPSRSSLSVSRGPANVGRHHDQNDQSTEPWSFSSDELVTEVECQLPSPSPEDNLTGAESTMKLSCPARPELTHFESSFRDDPKRPRANDETTNNHLEKLNGRTKKRDILLAAATVFLPLLAISLLLLGFTFYGRVRLTFPSDATINNDTRLPGRNPNLTHYYSDIGTAPYVLVGSWASTIALGIFTPFMLLFSFLVAWIAADETDTDSSHMMHEILRGNQNDGLWRWIKHVFKKMFCCGRARKADNRSLHIAGAGFLSAFMMSLLVIVADNWLHGTTQTVMVRVYNVSSVLSTGGKDPYAASYVLIENCLDSFGPDQVCSLDNETGGVASPLYTYLFLDTGITDTTSNFNYLDFNQLANAAAKQESSLDMVVHYIDGHTNATHAFLFFAGAAEEQPFEEKLDCGIDYVAQTISVSTTCSFVTSTCNISHNTSKDMPLLYNCPDYFQGDLNNAPALGIEKTAGWHTSFYDFTDDGYQAIPNVTTLSNPFNFFVAAALESISYDDVPHQTPEDVNSGSIFNAGGGRIAYILDCTAGVYDVNYTLLDSNIYEFNSRLSDEITAAIVRAPFQSSFGTYSLFQKASTALISSDPLQSMELALSEVIMAGAFGAFTYGDNLAQRFRWDQTVTQISKPALLYFVVVCLLYSLLGLALVVAAFVLRAKQRVKAKQAALMSDLKMSRIVPRMILRKGQKNARKGANEKDDGDDSGQDSDEERLL